MKMSAPPLLPGTTTPEYVDILLSDTRAKDPAYRDALVAYFANGEKSTSALLTQYGLASKTRLDERIALLKERHNFAWKAATFLPDGGGELAPGHVSAEHLAFLIADTRTSGKSMPEALHDHYVDGLTPVQAIEKRGVNKVQFYQRIKTLQQRQEFAYKAYVSFLAWAASSGDHHRSHKEVIASLIAKVQMLLSDAGIEHKPLIKLEDVKHLVEELNSEAMLRISLARTIQSLLPPEQS